MLLNDKQKNDLSKRLISAVEKGLEDCKISARQASIAVVGHDGLIRDIRAGKIPSADRLEALFRFLGLEFYIGPPREVSPVPAVEIDGEDYAAIPRYDVELAAGDGRLNDEAAPVEHLAFSRAWLKRMGLAADQAVLVKVSGTSMQPTLHDGDLVLIDRRKQLVRDRRIYAFAEPGGDARVKRLEHAGDTLLIRSDNPDCPTEIRSAEEAARLTIIGEVVWSGHVLR